MNKKFRWFASSVHNPKGPIFYNSDKQQILAPHNSEFIRAMIETRVNGPKTAFARVTLSIEWPTEKKQHWGWDLHRHFEGKNAGRKARAWCNFLLDNPPYGITKWEGKK